MSKTRMNKLMRELNLPENSVYVPDKKKILSGVKCKIESADKRVVHGMSFYRAIVVGVVIALMLAVTVVAFGKGEVIRKIMMILEEPETETAATDEKVIDFVPVELTEPTEIPTEEETAQEETTQMKENPKYESAIFDKYHKEGSEKAEEYLTEVYESVEDNDFVLTVNEVLGDNKNVYLTATIEAKTAEGRAILMNETHIRFAIEAYDEVLGWVGVSAGYDEAVNARRENSKSYTIHIFGDSRLTNGYEKMRITCKSFASYIQGEKYVYFEIEPKTDVIEFELLGQGFDGGYFYLTPMSIELTAIKEPTAAYAPDARNLNTFFKFKNGMIKTFNQVIGFDGGYQRLDDGELYKYSAGTKNYLDLDTIESIIIKDIEYPVDNPSNYAPASVPSRLRPFIANDCYDENGMYYLCELKELTDRMQVEYLYDADGILEYKYDGKIYRVEAGNSLVLVNGETLYTLYLPPSVNENGEIIVGLEFATYIIGARRGEIEGTGEVLVVP